MLTSEKLSALWQYAENKLVADDNAVMTILAKDIQALVDHLEVVEAKLEAAEAALDAVGRCW